jgi:hypothetical protein
MIEQQTVSIAVAFIFISEINREGKGQGIDERRKNQNTASSASFVRLNPHAKEDSLFALFKGKPTTNDKRQAKRNKKTDNDEHNPQFCVFPPHLPLQRPSLLLK